MYISVWLHREHTHTVCVFEGAGRQNRWTCERISTIRGRVCVSVDLYVCVRVCVEAAAAAAAGDNDKSCDRHTHTSLSHTHSHLPWETQRLGSDFKAERSRNQSSVLRCELWLCPALFSSFYPVTARALAPSLQYEADFCQTIGVSRKCGHIFWYRCRKPQVDVVAMELKKT